MGGRPFYDDEAFAQRCPAGLNAALVERLHRAFVDAKDGEPAALKAWMGVCSKVNVVGGVNTPLRESGERALHRAAEHGRIEVLKWLVVQAADVNAATAPALDMSPDGDASSSLVPVHVAAINGHEEALSVLFSSGADLNARRPDGATALDFAVDCEQKEAAEWLQQRGG